MAKVRKAVITAAGRGTRQYPASNAVKKEMFPLVDRDGVSKPVIQIIGEEAIESGIGFDLVGVAGGSKHNAIPRHAEATVVATPEAAKAMRALAARLLEAGQ